MNTKTIFLTALLVCCSALSSCIQIKRSKSDVIKQVKVTASVANLRTGPGTNYAIASVNADGTGGKWQVVRGTHLDVVGERNGWYEVRPAGQERTAYIKQTLCDGSSTTTSKGSSGSRSSASAPASPSTSGESQEPAATTAETSDQPVTPAPAEEVIEEIKGAQPDDEVLF